MRAFEKARWSTLVEMLQWRAAEHPDRRAFTFLPNGRGDDETLTYGELDRQVRALAGALQAAGAEGERVILLLPPDRTFAVGFLATLYAGAVAVPTFPPRPGTHLKRLLAMLEDAAPRVVLTTHAIRASADENGWRHEAARGPSWLAIESLEAADAEGWRAPREVRAGAPAFLQYTSGTTGAPKGVVVTHGSLVHNMEAIAAAFENDEAARVVVWLPPYHDMGLVGGLLQPIYVGGQAIAMSPGAFLKKPRRWLEAITKYRGTVSGAPNFAYDLCVERIPPALREGLDLGSWELAFNGAEPVRAETLRRFTDAYAPHGFRARAFYVCYGLAEATLMVTGGKRLAGPTVHRFDEAALAAGRVRMIEDDAPGGRVLVSTGRAVGGQDVAIVDPPTGVPCPAGYIGEVWARGPSVAAGYWRRPRETHEAFGGKVLGDTGDYLRTGDLGFFHDGELYVAGRAKDLIIVRGTNHHPQDIEATVQAVSSALRMHAGAAFSFEHDGEEMLGVVQEVERGALVDGALLDAIRCAIAEEHGIQPAAIVLAARGQVPVTSSGKLMRRAVKEAFEKNALKVIAAWPISRKMMSDGAADAPFRVEATE